MESMSRMQRVCNKGYGWYVAAKAVKAVFAVPAFALSMVAITVLALLLALKRALESFWTEFLAEIPSMVSSYWSSRWFSGFSRKHWSSLYRKPKPVFWHEDATPAKGESNG